MPSSETNDLHFVLFSVMAQGHMIPMVDIARMLAHRGVCVTIVTTPLLSSRFKSVIARANEAKLQIQLLELQLPLVQVGLAKEYESFDGVPPMEVKPKIFAAIDMLEQPAEDLLRGLCPPPSCIISGHHLPWTTDLARRFNIPRLVFNGPGCFYQLCMHIVSTTRMLDGIKSDSERFVLNGLPDRVEVTKLKVSGNSETTTPEEKAFRDRFKEGEKLAYGIVVNSFNELEPEYVKELSKVKDKKVWCIGPVSGSLCDKDNNMDIAERGNKAAINQHECVKWLDEREPTSVLYVCFGSLMKISTSQTIQIGLGLESTNRPFIWCIRNKTNELEKWFSEQGFEERVKDRGLIVHGWAPQVLILSHQAIGGFLTHCGWNSTLEAISSGVPMITWPHFADQFLNEIFIVEVLKIGVRIGVDTPVSFEAEEDKGQKIVNKDNVKMAIECLMDQGEEGNRRRKFASELAELAKRAMDEGGSSYVNVSSLIQDIVNMKSAT